MTPMKPLEWCYNEAHDPNVCFTKVVVNTADKNRVIGAHFLGPNAGEVIQVSNKILNLVITLVDGRVLQFQSI